MKEKINCAIYTRVSTDNQAEVEFGSCEAQRNKIEYFIKSQIGFRVYDVFSDEGYSGKDLNRPAIQRMLEDIEMGNIDCVITYKMDRLTRLPKDFYHLIEHFEKYKVDFISVTERFDTSTPAGRLLRNIMLTFAQFERELASERTKDKLLQRAQKGMWNGGIVAFGYKSIDKKLIIVKKEAKIVKEIYEVFTDTKSVAKVYGYLISKGYKDKNGKFMTKDVIRYILRNIVYTGKIKYDGKIYKGNHEPIISEELYNEVQKYHKVTKRKWRQYKTFLFGGLVRCKECNRAMSPCFTSKKLSDNKINRFYYYRCSSTYKRDWNSCDIKQVSANRLENYVFECLNRMAVDRHYLYSSSREPGVRYVDEPNGLWSETELISSQKYIRKFLKAAEKLSGTERCQIIRNCVADIIYSKETIQVNMYWGNRQDNREGILEQARDESATRPQMDCGKSIDSNRVGQEENGRACRIDAGGVGDGPRRSAEGRSAGGHPPSDARSRAAEGVRWDAAERGIPMAKINNLGWHKNRNRKEKNSSDWTRTSNPLVTTVPMFP